MWWVTDELVLERNDGGGVWEEVASPGGGGGAPTDAQYVVAASHAGLSAERVLTGVTDHTTIDNGTAGQSKVNIQPHLDKADPHPQYALDTDLGLYVPKSLIDAKGDLLVGTANDTVARKAVGANGTFLKADSAQSDGLAWSTLADGDIPSTIARDSEAVLQTLADAKGDLIAASGADTWAKVAAASKDGDALTSDSSQAAGVKWGPGFLKVVLQSADVTHGAASFVNTDLVFDYVAGAVYVIDLYLMCSSAATTTGYRFAFDVSTSVTVAAIAFAHTTNATGGGALGDAIADATARGLSSGVGAANVTIPLLAQGLLVTSISTGTCRLVFGPEVAANATFKQNSVMRVMRVS